MFSWIYLLCEIKVDFYGLQAIIRNTACGHTYHKVELTTHTSKQQKQLVKLVYKFYTPPVDSGAYCLWRIDRGFEFNLGCKVHIYKIISVQILCLYRLWDRPISHSRNPTVCPNKGRYFSVISHTASTDDQECWTCNTTKTYRRQHHRNRTAQTLHTYRTTIVEGSEAALTLQQKGEQHRNPVPL
jgi:hypothetical protein